MESDEVGFGKCYYCGEVTSSWGRILGDRIPICSACPLRLEADERRFMETLVQMAIKQQVKLEEDKANLRIALRAVGRLLPTEDQGFALAHQIIKAALAKTDDSIGGGR